MWAERNFKVNNSLSHILRDLITRRRSGPYPIAKSQSHNLVSSTILCKTVTDRQIHVNYKSVHKKIWTSTCVRGIL
jgi:hypothetical protein